MSITEYISGAHPVSAETENWEDVIARRTHRDIFLQKLATLSKDGEILVGNIALRNSLGWPPAKYKRIKARLFSEGAIIIGRGKGGSVTLASASDGAGLSVFVAYARADEELKEHLLRHLRPLQRIRQIDVWHDGKITPGAKWEESVNAALEQADIILLLISIDFINSEYCYGVELERALERHEEEKAIVVPVILRQCLWQHSPFANLHALPKDAKAVMSWTDRDEAFTNVAEGVRVVAEDLLAR